MDIDFFLKERTKFIRYFYEAAIDPFTKTMNDIENAVPPYVPPYSEDSEPAFLSEWLDANSGFVTCGHHALSMLSSSLKLFLAAWVDRLDEYHGMKFKVNFSKKGWFNGYREIFQEIGLDMSLCPANLGIIEQIPLVRNRIQHPEEILTISVYHSKSDLNKHPNPYFVQEFERAIDSTEEEPSWLYPPTIAPSKEKILAAILNVEQLCTWLEKEYWEARSG